MKYMSKIYINLAYIKSKLPFIEVWSLIDPHVGTFDREN
jgi:hypothetical protein